MNIFALDSSGISASVAILSEQGILYQNTINEGLTHSETLLPLCEKAFSNSSLTIDDIDVFAVAQGPGSFTGLRIGIGLIKGFAFKNDTPCVGVSTLKAVAVKALTDQNIAVSLIDAKNNRFYFGAYCLEDGVVVSVLQDELLSDEKIFEKISKIQKDIVLTGNGKRLFYDNFKDKFNQKINVSLTEQDDHLSAVDIAKLAKVALQNGEAVSSFMLKPLYLELSQAARNLKMSK